MSEPTLKKFRLSIARMTFTEMEVFAADRLTAEAMGRGAEGSAFKFEMGPFVHRVEQRVPVAGRSGEYTWEEAKP